VSGEPAKGSTSHGLAFLSFLSFVASFAGARIFTTFFPSTAVVTGGVHLHHFWYGLVMVAVAGWLGIAQIKPNLRRSYAVVFGIGGGLIGDEVGLLLTLGNYYSDLTYFFFLLVVALGAMGILAAGYKHELEDDVRSLEHGERTAYLGVVITGLSALSFAGGYVAYGAATLTVGLLITAAGVWWHRRAVRVTTAAQS